MLIIINIVHVISVCNHKKAHNIIFSFDCHLHMFYFLIFIFHVYVHTVIDKVIITD